MFRAMTMPGDVSDGSFGGCVRPTGRDESVCVYTGSAVLGRELVYVNLYIKSV